MAGEDYAYEQWQWDELLAGLVAKDARIGELEAENGQLSESNLFHLQDKMKLSARAEGLEALLEKARGPLVQHKECDQMVDGRGEPFGCWICQLRDETDPERALRGEGG